MIRAGEFNWVNPDITEKNFPMEGKGKIQVNLELVHYDKVMTSEEVLADFQATGLKPAKIEYGLAFAASNPDLQRKFPIVMLGSVCQSPDRFRDVPFLSGDDGWRGLFLGWFGDGWGEGFRFLAVRESMPVGRQA